jgi:hypothetical protein
MASLRGRLILFVGLTAVGCSALDGLFDKSQDLAIVKFAVSPKQVTAGTVATLSWNVEGASSVTIDGGVGVVQSKGSLEVRAERSKSFTLQAKGATSSASATVELVVSGTAIVPSPSPSASATPSPSPSPSPSASPTPSPSPSATGCSLPANPDCGRSEGPTGVYGCCRTDRAGPLPASPFDDAVDAVQDAIGRERPDLFDRDGRVNEDAYVDELVRRLRARGLCVTRGGPTDEVGIKSSNSESFQYDVHLGNGRPRLSGYTSYCRPARF